MLSDPTLTTALSTLKFQIPCSIILLALVHDFLQYVQEYIPSVFTRPFQNFLTLDDLKSEAAVPVLVPLWKKRVLASLAFLEAAIWLASFSFTILVQNVGESREDLVLLLAWVRVCLEFRLCTSWQRTLTIRSASSTSGTSPNHC